MKVSVVLPTYNCCKLLHEAIVSVLGQELQDYELIVIDDGSTDETRQVVAAFADQRIRYYSKPHGGVGSARNAGVERGTGQYIAFFDSDDLWPPDFLKVMISRLERMPDCGLAYSAMTNVYPDGSSKEAFRADRCASGWVARKLFHKSFVPLPCTVVRRGVLDGICWDETLRTGSDVEVLLRLACVTQFLYVPDVHLVRRVRKGSVSQHVSPRNLECNKARVLERFYFRLGGKDHVPKGEALRRISHTYRKTARHFYRFGAWEGAAKLFKRAIAYNPLSIRAYVGLTKALLKPRSSDVMPDWQIPPRLGDEITRRGAGTEPGPKPQSTTERTENTEERI